MHAARGADALLAGGAGGGALDIVAVLGGHRVVAVCGIWRICVRVFLFSVFLDYFGYEMVTVSGLNNESVFAKGGESRIYVM